MGYSGKNTGVLWLTRLEPCGIGRRTPNMNPSSLLNFTSRGGRLRLHGRPPSSLHSTVLIAIATTENAFKN